MIYFSELRNGRFFDKNGTLVGFVDDLIFLATSEAYVTKVVVRPKRGKKRKIFELKTAIFAKESLCMSGELLPTELSEDELYLTQNILDKQIIDISGNKIVRVNDVLISDKPRWLISGVDIGLMGIARWFGFEKILSKISLLLYKRPLTERLLSWADIHPLELARGKVVLKKEKKSLMKLRPEDLADHLEVTTINNAHKTIGVLDEEFAAEVIANLNLGYQTALFARFSAEKSAKIIDLIDPDEAVDIILTLPKENRVQILDLLEPQKKEELMYLLNLSKTPIGERITSEFLTLPSDCTVRQAKVEIKNRTVEFASFNYIYVLNDKKQLAGVVNLHEILMQEEDVPLYRFMAQNVVVVHLSSLENVVVRKMLKYKLQALPVIDAQKKMVGIINADDVSEYILEKFKI